MRYDTGSAKELHLSQLQVNQTPSTSSCIQNTQGSRSNADSDSVGLGWTLRVCISNKLPGDVSAAGPQTMICVARCRPLETSEQKKDTVKTIV